MDGPFELLIECFTADQARTWVQKLGGEPVGATGCLVRADSPLDLW